MWSALGALVCAALAGSAPVGAQTPTPACDFNQDGVVDAADLLLFHRYWYDEYAASPTPTETERPSPTETPGDHPADLTIVLPGDVTMAFMRCPAGSFQMGSHDGPDWSSCYPCEQPVHTVTFAQDFWMGRHEVTQAQWKAIMGSNPSSYSSCGDDCPVETVAWNDCQAFIAALNAHVAGTGQGPATFRLPSEAEWEYACRAGTATRFSFGDSTCQPTGCVSCELSDHAWWCGNNTLDGPKPVGTKLPNAWGLYDMHGNVWEWCQDWWHETYQGAPADGSAWVVPAGSYRVLRGGVWLNIARNCRSANRSRIDPLVAHNNFGLRLAGTP